MSRRFLLSYQWLTGLSDTATGIVLCITPAFGLRMMRLTVPADALPYVAYIGAFVFSVGLSGVCGAVLMHRRAPAPALEVVWLLTAFARASVAVFVVKAVLVGQLENGWILVAAFDGACVVFQGIGLRQRWLVDEA
jgi:hypothetical protein